MKEYYNIKNKENGFQKQANEPKECNKYLNLLSNENDSSKIQNKNKKLENDYSLKFSDKTKKWKKYDEGEL